MARRVVSINKKVYEQVRTLISEGNNYVVWKEKSKKPYGSDSYVVDHVNLYVKDFVPRSDLVTPQVFTKMINTQFRCFIVPVNFTSSDPQSSLRHMKLNITGVESVKENT